MAEQRSTLIIEISSEQARRNAQALDRELRSIQNSGNYASTSMNSMSVACRQLAGYMMGIVTVGTAISKMDEFTNLNNRLRLVTDSQKELTLAMKDTFDIAQRSGAAWGGTAAIYQKIQYNSEKLGLSQTQVAKVTESISKSISNSGSSAQAASAALYQLGQSFDKSSLNGDEFVSMSENAGYLMEVFSKGLGVTRAELKEMSSQGQLTTDKMIQAIQKMSDSIEEDFGKTNFTIGQSFTQLGNAVTKFVGEAGQGSGASSLLSSSIKGLADNLGTIANVAMLGGVSLLTKMIIDQTLSAKGAIAASIQRRAAMTAELESQVRLTALEAQRTRQVAALALTEVNLARQEFNSATTRTTRAAATIRLTQAEIAHNLAVNQSTAALGANTVAQNALNASRTLGARALALVGGPIGAIVLGVTALAAGYMYMSGKAAEANQKLAEQAEVAKKAKEELMALRGLEKDDAINDMTESLTRQNQALSESSSTINMQLDAIGRLYKGNKDVVKVVQDAKDGTISMSDAVIHFNEIRINKEVYNSFKKNADIFSKNALEATNSQAKLKMLGFEFETTGKKAQISTNGINASTVELEKNAVAASNATSKLQSYYASLRDQNYSNSLTIGYLNDGYSVEQAQALSKAWSEAYESGEIITKEREQQILRSVALEVQKNKLVDDRNKKEKDQTKEMEAQQKLQAKQAVLLAGNNEQTRNMLRVYQAFRSTGLGDKQSRVMTAQVGRENDFVSDAMFGSHKDKNNGYTNSGFISWQKGRSTQLMQYLQSQGVLDKKGNIEQTQDGLDAQARFLVQEISTGKGYRKSKTALANDDLDYRSLEKIIGQNLIGWDYTGKSGLGAEKASKHLAKQDNYHSQLSKILGSNPEIVSSSLKDISKIEDEAYKAKAKTEDDIRQLQAQFDTEAIQRSKERDEQINQATILGQMDLIPKIRERYNKQELLASYQLEMELNGYKWGEDQKIEYRRDIAKLEYDISGKYGAEELKLRKNGIDALAQYEIDEYRKTQQLKIAEYQMAFSQPLTDLQAEVLDMQAKANMGDYGSWALQNQYGKDLNSFGVKYGKNVNSINEDKTITDDAARKQLLLQAEESFRQSKLALNEKYTLFEQDLAKSQHQEQLQIWGSLLGQAQNTWSQITQAVKDSNGEQSTSFKIAFAAQQMFAMGSATISALQAYNQILASPWYMDVMSKTTAANMVLGMGMANVGMIGAQALTGMAHNGIDNIPKEGTWLLDGGERVLNPQQNKDLTNYLSNKGSSGGNIEVNVQVTDSGVTSQSNQTDQKQLGQLIGNAVRAVIMQEKRQGGLLVK